MKHSIFQNNSIIYVVITSLLILAIFNVGCTAPVKMPEQPSPLSSVNITPTPIVTSTYIRPDDVNKSNFNFYVRGCSSITGYYGEKPRIYNITSINESVLLIEVEHTNICNTEYYGRYGINDTTLVLYYDIQIPQYPTKCVCTHKLFYEFTDLQFQPLNVILVEGRITYPPYELADFN